AAPAENSVQHTAKAIPVKVVVEASAIPTQTGPIVIQPTLMVEEETGKRHKKSGFPRGEEPPSRRSFVDITAPACCGHAEDYSWLRGEIEYSRLANGWRLRYASVDDDDAYGGSVTLSGDQLQDLKDGMRVMVKGEMREAESRRSAPTYRVVSFEML